MMFTNQNWTTNSRLTGAAENFHTGSVQLGHMKKSVLNDPLKILIVDDSTVNQMIVEKHVNILGHLAGIAGNGEQAIEMLRNYTYDLILMDVQMPIMDGVITTQYIRQVLCNKSIKIIAMTSSLELSEEEKYYEVGINSCLEKPVSAIQLSEKIQELGF